jgi:two-component system cell cycle response regulator DivK
MRKTVLIIDDNDHERHIFSSFLRFVGGTVLEARNGEEGLRMAQEHLPTLILLDLSMPVLDGWETIRRLKQEPLTDWIPVIALTAHHLEWGRLREAGFSGYLEKPIVPFRVLEEVEHCIGRLHMKPATAREDSPDWNRMRDLDQPGSGGGALSRSGR